MIQKSQMPRGLPRGRRGMGGFGIDRYIRFWLTGVIDNLLQVLSPHTVVGSYFYKQRPGYYCEVLRWLCRPSRWYVLLMFTLTYIKPYILSTTLPLLRVLHILRDSSHCSGGLWNRECCCCWATKVFSFSGNWWLCWQQEFSVWKVVGKPGSLVVL